MNRWARKLIAASANVTHSAKVLVLLFGRRRAGSEASVNRFRASALQFVPTTAAALAATIPGAKSVEFHFSQALSSVGQLTFKTGQMCDANHG